MRIFGGADFRHVDARSHVNVDEAGALCHDRLPWQASSMWIPLVTTHATAAGVATSITQASDRAQGHPQVKGGAPTPSAADPMACEDAQNQTICVRSYGFGDRRNAK